MTPGIADWIRVARDRRNNPVALLELQIELGVQILAFQDQRREFETELADANAANKRGGLETAIAHVRQGVRIVRAIGDAIAWRALDFDRAMVRQLSEKNPTGGLERESFTIEAETAMRDAESTGNTVVLNDVTNCLRFADLTEVGESSIELVEVKGGRGSARSGHATRQGQITRERVELLKRGLAPGPDGELAALIYTDIIAKSHMPDVAPIIEEASKSGHADGRITPSLAVSIVWPSVLVDRGVETKIHPNNPFSESARGITTSTLELFGRWSYNMAPIALFPLPDAHRAALLTGQGVIYSHMSIDRIVRALRRRGLIVKLPEEKVLEEMAGLMPGEVANHELDAPMVITRPNSAVTLDISFVPFGRVWTEFLDEESIADLMESMFRQNRHLGYIFPRFANESDLWD